MTPEGSSSSLLGAAPQLRNEASLPIVSLEWAGQELAQSQHSRFLPARAPGCALVREGGQCYTDCLFSLKYVALPGSFVLRKDSRDWKSQNIGLSEYHL